MLSQYSSILPNSLHHICPTYVPLFLTKHLKEIILVFIVVCNQFDFSIIQYILTSKDKLSPWLWYHRQPLIVKLPLGNYCGVRCVVSEQLSPLIKCHNSECVYQEQNCSNQIYDSGASSLYQYSHLITLYSENTSFHSVQQLSSYSFTLHHSKLFAGWFQ